MIGNSIYHRRESIQLYKNSRDDSGVSICALNSDGDGKGRRQKWKGNSTLKGRVPIISGVWAVSLHVRTMSYL